MPLTIDEVRAHPGFPTAIIPQKPDLKGWGPAGKDRGRPFNIACELFRAMHTNLTKADDVKLKPTATGQ